jgi:hypothetical protein
MMLSEALFGPPTLMIRRQLSQKEAKRLFLATVLLWLLMMTAVHEPVEKGF